MQLERYQPTHWLRPFIREFIIIESNEEVVNQVVPDTSMVMAFRLKGAVLQGRGHLVTIPSCVLTGLQAGTRLLTYTSHTATLLVLFEAGGAAAFFREPLHELFRDSTPLDALLPASELAVIENQLVLAATNADRIRIVEQFLCTKLKWTIPDKMLLQALGMIQADRGSTAIHRLARSAGLSQDAFEKRFRRAVGSTPKQFARIVRFRSLIRTYRPGQRLTDLAYEGGYFDQAHFINDFRSFTGQCPQDFFKVSVYW